MPCTPCRCDLKHRDRRRRQSTTSRLRPNSRERVGPARRRRRHRTSWTVPTTSSAACVTARATRCVEFTRTSPATRTPSPSLVVSAQVRARFSRRFVPVSVVSAAGAATATATCCEHKTGYAPGGSRAGDVQVQPTSSGQRTSAGRLQNVARHTESTPFFFFFFFATTPNRVLKSYRL